MLDLTSRAAESVGQGWVQETYIFKQFPGGTAGLGTILGESLLQRNCPDLVTECIGCASKPLGLLENIRNGFRHGSYPTRALIATERQAPCPN